LNEIRRSDVPGFKLRSRHLHVISKVIGQPVDFIWHRQNTVADCDAVILPGGFSYGDYLRTGAIARFSPVIGAVKGSPREAAGDGNLQRFQILCEAGLLPGALLRNKPAIHLRPREHPCRSDRPAYTNRCQRGQVLSVPIAHRRRNYFCDADTLAELQRENRIIFRYTDAAGNLTADANPNGSLDDIAGICNRERNVLGMMPHPERASEQLLGSADGRIIFYSLADTLAELAKAS
jgi:phosphoribosylformylglycinamidine synthase